ncbi:MAG: histidine kinase dimerization/phospho-acceptor domain-containing protein, partial [Pseudomonadota bacterium]
MKIAAMLCVSVGAGMFFDDRLATVLRQRGESDLGQRTQYRQLLDILGNRKYGRDQGLISAAWLRMDALAQTISASERAAMIREPSWRFRSADLAAHLADFEPEVASAALNRANLSEEDWSTLIPRLPVRARGFLRLRQDLPVDIEQLLERLGVYDRGLPAPAPGPAQATTAVEPSSDAEDKATSQPNETQDESEQTRALPEMTDADPVEAPSRSYQSPTPSPLFKSDDSDATESGRSEISALVERIAQFRRTREISASEAERSPRLPFGEAPPAVERQAQGFGFVADANGRIEWADADLAAMVIGTRLVAPPVIGMSEHESGLERAFARRQPLDGVAKTLAGAPLIAGDWVVHADPRFNDDGNFAGYVGRFRRAAKASDDAQSAAAREADRIRQLLHELRTPVTAVQGYAEVIQQQLFGPAPHEYRALAAVIAADAAHILAGFEELDRLAKLDTGASEVESGEADLAELATRTAAQLAEVLASRMAGIEFSENPCEPVMVALDPDDAEAMIWRLLATLGGGCATGETLEATLLTRGGMARLSCDLPAQLLSEEDIFAAEAKPIGSAINAGLFGAGFSLRLARAEARSAGG